MAAVVAVVGPTATGKSDLGIAIAREVGGHVVNADSMQLYRGMDIGTAKLTAAERDGVPHHLLDVWDVTHTATAAEYQRLAREAIDGLLARDVTPVLVGGSGLYLRAALDELSFPGTDPELRASLEAELEMHGALALHARLAALDQAAAGRMEPTNGRRVVRALEVVLLTGGMPGEMTAYAGHYDVTYLGLDRDDLAARTDQRVDRMWAAGLVDEVRALAAQGLRGGVTASRALGYAQVLAMLDGRYDETQAIEMTKTTTRRFVRRQRAWFRRDPRISWLDPEADLFEQGIAAVASK
ncbi:MAG: tRNA (adenosine(37)-N6)-dimethylallyltransferase MiaA [Frankiaceae bacterium]|nr:tRNA (adenosine(37)-N6)-dimethylallyltransferase MiaA [Frankiaceae bacterium]